MQASAFSPRHDDGRLWLIALGLSLLVNAVLVAALGFAVLESTLFTSQPVTASKPPPPAETVATIYAEMAKSASETRPAPLPVVSEKPTFARTSDDQIAPPVEKPAFIGERDTRATSDRAPDPSAPALPSQAGIAPKDSEIETTESDYKDGSLAGSSNPTPAVETPSPPTPAVPVPPEPAPSQENMARKSETKGQTAESSAPPPRETLLQSPNPVDVGVARETSKEEQIKPTPAREPAAQAPDAPAPKPPAKVAEAPKPKTTSEPAFKGFQRKTAVVGSISRTGRSALDVADTPLGRYQAAISRAVEQEWQRNCVRHRDFITPGFLTVRFFVETGGKVRSVQFVGEMETGEVQKGFTLNSIRDAEIPAMPPSLRKEYEKEPLELIFRFYF